MARRPTLLNGCAAAATTAEARFRIDAPARAAREIRVIALDSGAGQVVRSIETRSWRGVRFLSSDGRGPEGVYHESPRPDDGPPGPSGTGQAFLRELLASADFVLMVATSGTGAAVAAEVGAACSRLGIMTAGVILSDAPGQLAAEQTAAALRPHARVLLVSRDPGDVAELLAAVGA
jgi:hypothetical protein